MANCKIHNVRFYKPKPEAIYCMTFHATAKKLALSRADGTIEIWNLNHVPCIERTIIATVDNLSIEALTWCGDSLFSVGLNGLLIEYDLLTLTKKRVVTVTGEACYCIDVTKDARYIAVGTEQGYLNIFKVDEDDVLFEKFLDKQEGRILCLKYDPSCQFIASGSLDAIRIWDVKTGHALHRITTGRSEANQPTIVWCINILKDLTIVSGDSRGKLTMYDGKVGAQIESFQSHKADILSLCVSAGEDSIYCAGVDSNIVNYVKVKVTEGNYKWVKSVQRKVHEHDVRALVLHEGKLYSGGLDGYLACSYCPPKTLLKYPPILQNPCVVVAKKARCILLRFIDHLEIWGLGKSTDKKQNSDLLQLVEEPVHLLTLQRLVKNDGAEIKEGIVCSSISNDGKWIVFSTNSVLRIFNFSYSASETPSLLPIDDLPESCSVSLQAVFTPNCQRLILAPQSGGLQVYELVGGAPMLVQTIVTKTVLKDTITFLEISQSGRYLIAGDPSGNIAIWMLNQQSEWEHYCKLPRYSVSIPTSIALHPNDKNLIVTYADHKLVEYNIKRRRFTSFSLALEKQSIWPSKSFPVRNIAFDSRRQNIIILHDDSHIVIADQDKSLSKENVKIPKREVTSPSNRRSAANVSSSIFRTIKKYKHLVYLGWLSDEEMVAVEVSPQNLLEQLPPCLKQSKFGTK
ncbi:hypothetical protein PPYR_10889 [Photinus pyralis]|uniref:Uncharacterized protein n=2 Tax=Photinus pyralis TaxID=7054 RepID=A0A1Y1MM41_PHOPY|nr:U3 small nucleolar RNA-associated protein 4 homolog [Photinus pyralis]KAB0796828.1 hypothetical protein PPYR_10889 [Photinus pyralis]